MELATLQDKIDETVKSGKPKKYFNLMGMGRIFASG